MQYKPVSTRRVLLLVLTALAVQAGCIRPARDPVAIQTNRLIARYPALAGGRYAVIADFEDVRHATLFDVENLSGRASWAIDAGGGIRQTGRDALRVTLAGPTDALRAGAADSEAWFLKRDWRDYDLLYMSVYLEADPSSPLRVSFVSGVGAGAAATHAGAAVPGAGSDERRFQAELPLSRGWNHLAVDLWEVAQSIDIDDVRRITWSMPAAASPVEWHLDDVILTRDREALFGDADGKTGHMVVLREGRRMRVGAPGRFELTFHRARIVAWFDLARDPARLDNLVRHTTLGPTPITTAPPALAPSDTDQSGVVAAADTPGSGGGEPRLVSASAVRVILEESAPHSPNVVSSPSAPDAAGPVGGATRWVVYANGDVFVASVGDPASREQQRSYAFDAAVEGSWRVDAAGQFAELRSVDPPAVRLAITALGAEAPLANARSDSDAGLVVEAQPDLTWVLGLAVRDAVAWASSLRNPPRLDVAVGRIGFEHADADSTRDGSGGDGDASRGSLAGHDGSAFDRRWGAYRLRPEGDLLRFHFNCGAAAHHAFEVAVPPESVAAVYVDHVLHPLVARESDGRIIFLVDAVQSARPLIEVMLRRPSSADGVGR